MVKKSKGGAKEVSKGSEVTGNQKKPYDKMNNIIANLLSNLTCSMRFQGVLNVDFNEIAKFEEVAHEWWDLEGNFKPLHQINPLRRQFIIQHAKELFDKKAIDVGCGGGILAESLAKLGADVTGIDMGEEPLNVAKLHALDSNVNVDYQKITAEEKAKASPEAYDIVTCMEMLEHVPDPLNDFSEMIKSVKLNGYLVIANAFYPMIKCHLPQNFHFRYSFNYFANMMGLESVGVLEGSHATIFKKNRIYL